MQKFLIAFFLLIVLAQTGSGLECWDCSQVFKNGETCRDPFTNRAEKMTCPSGQVCVKHVSPKVSISNIEAPRVVTRSCGISSTCDSRLQDSSVHCSVCSTDLCNSSGIAVPSLITVAVLLIAAKCLYF